MTRMQLLGIVLGSAGLGALVSSVVNGIFAYVMKRQELLRQDEQIAARVTEMKHQQLLAAQDWAIKSEGKAREVDLWDPLVTAIGYLRGLAEFRKTGRWEKGETAHKSK